MSDWWDWWITTAVALPIAAVVLVLALVVKRRDAKIGLALFALVAIGIGVAAPFVMGDSMGAGPRLSAREFAHRADANCRNLDRSPASNFGKPALTPEFARRLDRFLPEMRDALRQQGQLRPPAAEEETARRWMKAMAAVSHDFETMRDAARRSDHKSFGAAGKSLSAHAGESLRLSKELGQTYCFQG